MESLQPPSPKKKVFTPLSSKFSSMLLWKHGNSGWIAFPVVSDVNIERIPNPKVTIRLRNPLYQVCYCWFSSLVWLLQLHPRSIATLFLLVAPKWNLGILETKPISPKKRRNSHGCFPDDLCRKGAKASFFFRYGLIPSILSRHRSQLLLSLGNLGNLSNSSGKIANSTHSLMEVLMSPEAWEIWRLLFQLLWLFAVNTSGFVWSKEPRRKHWGNGFSSSTPSHVIQIGQWNIYSIISSF